MFFCTATNVYVLTFVLFVWLVVPCCCYRDSGCRCGKRMPIGVCACVWVALRPSKVSVRKDFMMTMALYN